MTQTPPIWSAEKIVDAIFDDLRDRRFLKWLFRSEEGIIGDFQRLHSLDLEVQEEIRQAWAEIIRTSLASIPVSRRAETEGWVLVPKEPTEAMNCAAVDTFRQTLSAPSIYAAMIAASPAPLPVEEQEPVECEYRVRPVGITTWGEWRRGKANMSTGNGMEWEERDLYALSPNLALEAERDALEAIRLANYDAMQIMGAKIEANEGSVAALARAKAAEETLRDIIRAYDANSGAEPSVSVLDRAVDEARAALVKP